MSCVAYILSRLFEFRIPQLQDFLQAQMRDKGNLSHRKLKYCNQNHEIFELIHAFVDIFWIRFSQLQSDNTMSWQNSSFEVDS